jgi:hypothetical protein
MSGWGYGVCRRYVAAMSNELIAWVVAITLGIAVVVLGLRRNLSETTRNGLPRFEGDPERATAALGLYEGGERRRRSLSPKERRWMIWAYLPMSLTFAAFAVLSAHDRLSSAILAATFALNAAMLWHQGLSSSSDGSAP